MEQPLAGSAQRAQRRDEILRAAREVFFQRGFHTVTVDDIAVAAEVGKGTVYLYFDTKETILAHLLLEGLDRLAAELETAYAAERRLAARTRLRRMADAYLRFFKQNPEYYRLLMAFDRGQFQTSIDPGVYQEVHARSLYAAIAAWVPCYLRIIQRNEWKSSSWMECPPTVLVGLSSS